jgi:hypothetical protein
LLAPVLLDALYAVLQHVSLPNTAVIELPDFDGLWNASWTGSKRDTMIKTVRVHSPTPPRDLLAFTSKELAQYTVGVLNAGDVFALPGNEREYASVEAMLGNNTSIRLDENWQHTVSLLDPTHHIRLDIDPLDPPSSLRPGGGGRGGRKIVHSSTRT